VAPVAEEREFSAMGGEDGGEVMVDLVEGGVDLEAVGWVSSGVELFSFLFLSFKKKKLKIKLLNACNFKNHVFIYCILKLLK
jgi:hypothetical protein